MKSLLIVSAKGGTGRTMLTCQFAHYLRRVSRKRVLVLDLAEPACSAQLLGRGGQADVAGDAQAMDRRRPGATERTGSIQVPCAGEIAGLVSCDDPVRARYYANLRHLLAIASPWSDVCLIDCPVLPDLRAVCAAALVDAVVSPVVLSPECIDSVAELINGTYGIRNIRARLNSQLRLIGLLPVMVQSTPLQQAQGRWLQARLSGWLIPDPRDRHGYLHLPQREVIARAQGLGVSVTMYLLHLTESLIDGRRFVYVMTEFWKRLGDPVFSDFANNKQKTIRKQNGLGIFDTQSPADVLRSDIARALIEQTATFFFLPNPRADYDDYVYGFKLTEAEFNIVRTLGENSRLFLVKQGHHSAIGRLDLAGLGDVLDVLSGTTDNVELLDGIRAEVGDDPAAWLPVFHERLTKRRAGSGALNALPSRTPRTSGRGRDERPFFSGRRHARERHVDLCDQGVVGAVQCAGACGDDSRDDLGHRVWLRGGTRRGS